MPDSSARDIPDPAFPKRGEEPQNGRSAQNAVLVEDEAQLAFCAQAINGAEAQPFLKWAGGKAQLLPQLDGLLPERVERYFEPFVGAGAFFFHLKQRFPQVRAFLRDNNSELINAYVAVRVFPEELMRQLDMHLADFRANHQTYYYLVRRQHHLASEKVVERAARMIFLNKTCFNGLWRVNARGEFNVPIGSRTDRALYDRRNILAASFALRNVHLAVQDFRETMDEAHCDDFVYLDPPYVPVSETASFTAYTKEDFGLKEQRELAAQCADLHRRGVRFMLSNSDTASVRQLYRDFTIRAVRARRAINCNGSKRGAVPEVVVTNF